MPQPLPRNHRLREQALDAAKLDRIVAEANELEPRSQAGATSGGDPVRLRGLPAVSRHTGGVMSGTDPVRALLAKERQR